MLCYAVMYIYGANKGIALMQVACLFAEICVLLAIAYKLLAPARAAQLA